MHRRRLAVGLRGCGYRLSTFVRIEIDYGAKETLPCARQLLPEKRKAGHQPDCYKALL